MRRRGLIAAVLTAVTATIGCVAQPATAATSTQEATVVVAPEGGGIIRSGKDLLVDVSVTNSGTTALSSGDLAYSMEAQPSASSTALLSEIAEPTQILLGKLITGVTSKVPALAVGASSTIRARVTAAELSSILSQGSGARIFYARYRANDDVVQTVGKSSVVRMASGFSGSVGFGTVIPLTAPANTTGLVSTDEQATLTSDDGAWSAALTAAERSSTATIALDPEVIASIRLAGTAAPGSALDFLDRLRALPNEFVELPYGDTDVTLQRAAGSTSTLSPTSFTGTSVDSSGTATATPTPRPTPTGSTAGSGGGSDEVTDWQWSSQHVAWPVPGTTSGADLTTFATEREAPLLPSDDVQDSTARRTAGPVATIGDTRVLIADSTASTLLARAASGGISGDAAFAELAGVLASAAATGETTGLIAAAGRNADLRNLARVLGVLDRQPWITGRTLQTIAEQRTVVGVRASRSSISSTRVAIAKRLLVGEHDVRDLGKAILQGGDALTGPQRLALLGALSAAWRGDDTDWTTAATQLESQFSAITSRVQLQKQSDQNAIGSDGKLLVYVRNRLDYPVRMVVKAAVSNGRLQFAGDSSTVLIVPAASDAKGQLEFRTIANGVTDVTLSLTTPDGASVGSPTVLRVNVRAGFDTIVAVVLLTALGLLLALGVYRNVKRRKQPRAVL